MSYFKINDIDFSNIVSELKIKNNASYNSQVNANGNTLVDLINNKRTIEVTIIPIDGTRMAQLLEEVNKFNVSISYRNPNTNQLETGINCIIGENEVEYYQILVNKTTYKAFSLKFNEL